MKRRSTLWWLALAVWLSWMLATPAARACASCGAGDPTLTVMGDEKTFAGRARGSAELRVAGVSVGAPGSTFEVSEERVELSAAYAPTRMTLLILAVPLLHRDATFPDLHLASLFTIGDVELRVKQFLWIQRRGAYQHQVALQGGVKAPTSPTENDDHETPLPAELQPGMGSVVPFAGIFYGLGNAPWSLYASATLYLPYAVRASGHAGDSFRSSVSVQRQVGRPFAARLGLDTRLDASCESNGKPDPNSGGFVAYISPAIVVSPAMDLLLTAGVHAPVLQAFQGFHHEATIAAFGVTYDF